MKPKERAYPATKTPTLVVSGFLARAKISWGVVSLANSTEMLLSGFPLTWKATDFTVEEGRRKKALRLRSGNGKKKEEQFLKLKAGD